MLKFKDYVAEDAALEKELEALIDEELENEAVSIQTRMKMKANLRRNKAKIAVGKRKAARKVADADVLKKRANRQARAAVLAKILKDKDKEELSYGARAAAEKRLETKKGLIARLARKLLPKVRKADREKFSKQTTGDQGSN